VLQNPSIYATLLSLCIFYFDVSVPQPVQDIFNYLGDMVVPCSMMLIGASLGRVSVRDIFGDMRVYLVSLARLILMPLIVALLTRLFIREPMFRNLITITSVMPSASLSPILSAEYGGNTLLASKSVFMTTLFSLLTVRSCSRSCWSACKIVLYFSEAFIYNE
jgi:predicted permease